MRARDWGVVLMTIYYIDVKKKRKKEKSWHFNEGMNVISLVVMTDSCW